MVGQPVDDLREYQFLVASPENLERTSELMKTNLKLIVRLLLCVSVLVSASLSCNFPASANPVIVVAMNYEGLPTLALYAGDPQRDPFRLPAGEYYIEAVDSEGRVYAGWRETISSVQAGGDSVPLRQRVSGAGKPDEAIASQLMTLANFMLSVELAQLTYLETASSGFQRSFKDSIDVIQMSDVDALYARLQEISDQQEEVRAAAQALEARMRQAASDVRQGGGKLASLPALREPLDLGDSLEQFFTFKSEEDEKAREEILTVSASMTPEEKEEAFSWLDEKNTGGARNYDEFLQLLQEGQLGDVTGIRSDLYTGGPYQGVYQTVFPESNRPGGETTHRVGAELLQRGAELEFEIVKETLTAAFPEIQQGFEYADKASEWAEFVNNMYVNPLGTLYDMSVDQIKSEIADRIQQDLLSAMPDLEEETAEQLAGDLTDEIMDTQPAIATAVAVIRKTLTPEDEKDSRDSNSHVCDGTSALQVKGVITRQETVDEFGSRSCDYQLEITNTDPVNSVYFYINQYEEDVYAGTEGFDWMGGFLVAPGEMVEWKGSYVVISKDPDATGLVMSSAEFMAGVYDLPECAERKWDEKFLEQVSVPLAPVCPTE